jgi:hypothetical protein
MARNDPDEALVALFKQHPVPNELRSRAEGRPIFDDMEVVEIRIPGSRDIKVFPATAQSHWEPDPETGGLKIVTYAERFRHQYQQFKRRDTQTKSGTPLDYVPFLSEGKRAELRAQNIYTVEALAAIDGQELKNLGSGGREWKNAAMAYITEAKSTAPNKQLEAELMALRARNAVLEEDATVKKTMVQQAEAEFEEMDLPQLREYIATHTGQEPLGNINNMNKKTLIRMAVECRPAKAA